MFNVIKEYGYNRNAKYCVASMSRCGSTMMTRYLIKKFGLKYLTGLHKREFSEFDGKVIFLFGNVFNTVVSVHRRIHKTLGTHYYHMGGEYNRRKDFWVYDSLHVEELFDDWYRPHPFKMVSIRYEKLWSKLDKLGEYLDLDMSDFPRRKPRKTDWTTLRKEERKLLKKTYRRINNKIESAADFKIWSP